MSWDAIPTIISLWARCRCWAAASSGNSRRHWSHHDAQKLRSTGCPTSWASDTTCPSRVRSVKAGAGVPPTGPPGVVTADGAVEVVALAAGDRLRDEPEVTAQTVSPTTTTTTTAVTATNGPRPARRGSVGPDEGVEGNGREEEREIGVREAEEGDRALRRRALAE